MRPALPLIAIAGLLMTGSAQLGLLPGRLMPCLRTLLIGSIGLVLSASCQNAPDGDLEIAESPDVASAALACGELDRVDDYVQTYQDMAVFDGVVLIAQDDEIVYLCGYGMADYRVGTPVGSDSRFRVASLSKQFTQAAIGRLIDDGLVSLDDALAEHLPSFPGAERITLRQLVEHTSGVPHTNRLSWMDMREALTLDEIVSGLAKEPLAFEPGSKNAYSNGGYALLAAVLEAASGQSFEALVQTEIASRGFPSVGHEPHLSVIPGLVNRYAPGPVYGERADAQKYVSSNRIGGGSLYANAEDIWRFFRSTYMGEFLSKAVTAELFALPSDGDLLITGRAPGALAQVSLDFNSGLSVVTLSSNSGWPGSFNPDIVALYRGEDVALIPFVIDNAPVTREFAASHTGAFVAERFGWEVVIQTTDTGFVFVQDGVRTAFARTQSGSFHLPLYDWLCDYEEDGSGFTCRQRDPKADIRFAFKRAPCVRDGARDRPQHSKQLRPVSTLKREDGIAGRDPAVEPR